MLTIYKTKQHPPKLPHVQGHYECSYELCAFYMPYDAHSDKDIIPEFWEDQTAM